MNSTLKQFKLSTGVEIVGRISSEDDTHFWTHNPLEIERIIVSPSVFYTMKSFFLNQFEENTEISAPDVLIPFRKDSVISIAESTSKVIQQYESSITYLKSGEAENELQDVAESSAELEYSGDDYDGDSDGPGNLLIFPGSDKLN